jgi:hypothetical protein
MEKERFDGFARIVARGISRRGLVAALGLLGIALPGSAEAKKKLKKNAYGCVNVGGKCRGKDAACCSGICEGKKPKRGKKDKSTCVGHDESTCAGQDRCAGEAVTCITAMDISGACAVTTGNASYCAASIICADCAQDRDCAAICDTGAACIVCPGCGEFQTACASTTEEGCQPG